MKKLRMSGHSIAIIIRRQKPSSPKDFYFLHAVFNGDVIPDDDISIESKDKMDKGYGKVLSDYRKLSCHLNWEGIARLLKVPQGFELVFPKKLKGSKDILAVHENGLLLHCPEGSKQAEIINLIQPKS